MLKLRCFSNDKLQMLLKDACLKESLFWTERKLYPEIENLVKYSERDEMVAYLLEVCERPDMSLSIETFCLAVTLLDRFLATFKVKSKYLECLAVSCLYISCKIKEEDEKISSVADFLIDCNSKCSVSELLRMELMILTKFEWTVNDITAVDFLHIYHALIVNNYNQLLEKSKLMAPTNKWKSIQRLQDNKPVDSYFPPSDLDFLHLVEYELKQLVCTNELTTLFKPRVFAFTLLDIQLEKAYKSMDSSDVFKTNAKLVLKQIMNELMPSLQQQSKITDQVLAECKEKVNFHLATIDANKNLLNRYMNEYYSEIARNFRASRLSFTLSAINTSLTAIEEEDEEEADKMDQKAKLNSPANLFRLNSTNSTAHCDNFQALISNQSYASKVINKLDQKRKLSGDSNAGQEFECDYESRH